jgi:hypothetical protein
VTASTPGLDLARDFYAEAVESLVGVPHTAALIGEGSEILGYDDAQSRDHEWGPRLQVFVDEGDVRDVEDRIERGLPDVFRGSPTSWFSLIAGRDAHHVEVSTLGGWVSARLPTLPFTPTDPLDTAAWPTIPQQHLLQLTAGEVFRDDLGDLTRLRETFSWYPVDIWRWMIASQWNLLATTMPMLGRAEQTGDALGAGLLASQAIRQIMEMAFLLERRYRPYPKWFGRAFAELDMAERLSPSLRRALGAREGRGTEAKSEDGPVEPLLDALVVLATRHNELGISAPGTPRIGPFKVGINEAVRPYRTLDIGPFIEATVASIEDPALRELPRVGSIDQLTHADDQLINFTSWPRILREDLRRELERATP